MFQPDACEHQARQVMIGDYRISFPGCLGLVRFYPITQGIWSAGMKCPESVTAGVGSGTRGFFAVLQFFKSQAVPVEGGWR